MDKIEEIARAIHEARFANISAEHRPPPTRDYSDEEYCLRLARAAYEVMTSSDGAGAGQNAYEQGYRDGFVDATITEDGFPDEATVLKRVRGVNVAEGWDAYRDTFVALSVQGSSLDG